MGGNAEDLKFTEPDISQAEWRERLAAMSAVSEAVYKLDRIMTLVYAAIPQGHGSKLTFGQALRRYRPR